MAPVTGSGSAAIVAGPASGSGDATADPWATGSGGAAIAEDDTGMPSMLATREIADAACPTVKAAYFYRIDKGGKVSYLLGTRHLGVDLKKLPAEVSERISAARLAVFETAPDDKGEAPHPPHHKISEELGPELWAHYRELMGDELAASLDDEEPPTALLMMMALYEDKSSALDDELTQVAIEHKIPVQGLETSEFQDRLINKWLGTRALRGGVKVTDDRAEIRQETVDDLTEYCAGTGTEAGPDAKERQDLLDAGFSEAEIAQYEEELVFARNRSWIPKLEKILAKGNAFIAVGADHLKGDKGVVSLLSRRGYKVIRVTPPAP